MARELLNEFNKNEGKDNDLKTESNSNEFEKDKRQKYAAMFPDWDLLPPQVIVRRINRKA